MIQDIFPMKLYNEYQGRKPESEDSIICIHNGEILIKTDENNELSFPQVKSLNENEIKELIYLFKIDETYYYLFMCNKDFTIDGFPSETIRLLRQKVSKDKCMAAATAYHLYQWYKVNRYCGCCKALLIHSEEERMLRCPKCGNMVYPKIAPAVIVAVKNNDKILLTKYAGRVYKRYALIAGFTEIGETAEETVKREVMEEAGLKVKNITYYKSQPWGTDSNLLMGFFADLDGDDTITMDTDELSVAEWVSREDMSVLDDGISLTREMMRVFKEGE